MQSLDIYYNVKRSNTSQARSVKDSYQTISRTSIPSRITFALHLQDRIVRYVMPQCGIFRDTEILTWRIANIQDKSHVKKTKRLSLLSAIVGIRYDMIKK